MQLTDSGYPPRTLRKRYTQGRIEKREREKEREGEGEHGETPEKGNLIERSYLLLDRK